MKSTRVPGDHRPILTIPPTEFNQLSSPDGGGQETILEEDQGFGRVFPLRWPRIFIGNNVVNRLRIFLSGGFVSCNRCLFSFIL